MASKSTASSDILPSKTPLETASSQSVENITTSYVGYTTLATSLVSPTETALLSNETATTPTDAAGPIVISPDDIPPGWIPDMEREDTIAFHNELIIMLGLLAMGILAVWVWSLCGCWWRGECFWHCDQGTCWGIPKKWRRMRMKKKGYREQTT
ncbi:hypothetical protein PMIN04_008355 [Paraphaeosphaeria minitans]